MHQNVVDPLVYHFKELKFERGTDSNSAMPLIFLELWFLLAIICMVSHLSNLKKKKMSRCLGNQTF